MRPRRALRRANQALNEQVKRNPDAFRRFRVRAHPRRARRGGRKLRPPPAPQVFPDDAVRLHRARGVDAASVLNTPRAVEVSLYVVRAFVELREALATNKGLAKRLDELESRLERKLATHDQAIAGILEAIRQLMAPPEPTKKRRIGFVQSD